MNGVHQSFSDGEGLVEHLGDRTQAVGCARRIRDYVVLLRVIGLLVDAQDYGHIFVFCWSSYDDFLDRVSQMFGGIVALCE